MFALLAAGAGVALVFAVHVRIAAGQLPADRQRELLRIALTTAPLDVVCAPVDLLDWVPALAGRAAGEPGPWIPAIYRDEWNRRVLRPCPGPSPERAAVPVPTPPWPVDGGTVSPDRPVLR